MSPEDKEYFKNYFDMFDSPGWKQFTKDYEDAKDDLQLNGLYQIKNMDDLLVLKSRLNFCDQILNFEDVMRSQYEVEEHESNLH